jgi:hypothetical protein
MGWFKLADVVGCASALQFADYFKDLVKLSSSS